MGSFPRECGSGDFRVSKVLLVFGITGHLASREAIASYHKIKNGTWYGIRVKNTTSGYKT